MIDLTAIRAAAAEKGWRITQRRSGANHYITVHYRENPPRQPLDALFFVKQFFPQARTTSYGASISATYNVGNALEILKND